MATSKNLWVTEFGARAGAGNDAPFGVEPKITQQLISVSSASATASNLFNANTRFARLFADGLVHIRFSSAGTDATSTSMPLPASRPEYFGVNRTLKLSVISS